MRRLGCLQRISPTTRWAMMENNLMALYGLKHRPFTISVGVENLWVPPYAKAFIDRVDDVVLDGGFALLCGEAGLGKSKIMQVYAQRLKGLSSDIAIDAEENFYVTGDTNFSVFPFSGDS